MHLDCNLKTFFLKPKFYSSNYCGNMPWQPLYTVVYIWAVSWFAGLYYALAYDLITSYVVGILHLLVPLYILLIFTMAWRAGARVGKLSSWTKQCSCAGALLFCISDFTIAVNKFSHPVPYSHTIIMSTYYAAQMLIALSVIDSQVDAVIEHSRQTAASRHTGILVNKPGIASSH